MPVPACRVALIAACLIGSAPADAQIRWRAVVLHPEGEERSSATAVAGPYQGGYVGPEGTSYTVPVIWEGSSNSVRSLLPDGWERGEVLGMHGSVQVGQVLRSTFTQHAAVWWGSRESFYDLHPADHHASNARGVYGDQAVGISVPPNLYLWPHATLWDLRTGLHTDLHPSVALWSEAWATDGNLQGGRVDIEAQGQGIHAALWAGSADSFVDLHPNGASSSAVHGMAPGVQVGTAQVGTSHRAMLWRGSAQSAIDLTPDGAISAALNSTTGSIHGGYVRYSGSFARASIWFSDSAGDFVTLHHLLPGEWRSSVITGITVHNDTFYAAGFGFRVDEGTETSLLWVGTIPAPGTIAVFGSTCAASIRRPRRVSRPLHRPRTSQGTGRCQPRRVRCPS